VIARIRALNPGRSLAAIAFYQFARGCVRLCFRLTLGYRVRGLEHEPPEGPVIIVANHQSHLDPPAIGGAPRRHVCFVARRSLFKNKAFGGLIGLLNAFPINDEGGSDTAAIRAALDVLKQRRVLLIFPEGTRSPDGQIKDFKRGVWLLLSRAKCPVWPAAIDGAFDAFPRGRRFPTLFKHRVRVSFGKPIMPEELLAMKPEEGLERLKREVEGLARGLRG
jgi:1-acyl-sn-glycerol-3-phosphate acyltransferase